MPGCSGSKNGGIGLESEAVAWQPGSGRVLMMECKNVQYHRALGEVAEQLHDFRGELLPNG